ncbi:hypothetical protein [Salinicola aestuarinus]|uniref:hypothetical protein n=1 Tax=Salinicola aestuarinus TaxID=1949082 RepID=UPI000DA1964D|nr:hypothetical protein [Salinicola aestuarinus]
MHNVYVPVVAIVVAFAAIFGFQAFSESHLDDDIADKIAASLGTDTGVGIETMESVQKGYGFCGTYVTDGAAPAPFYFSKVDERVVLDTDARELQNHCMD